ncbi:MAG: MBL fold metallo-hydrolase [Hydrogenophilales bacterium CG_4_9_14_3_um_filter_63_34]|nr:MAG: MBL fold metallo-hydrolase [Hydrogenophilales bacterium CG_4_9_14_3_um_filter_63_34]
MFPTQHHEHGIHTVDAGYLRPGLASIHLIVEGGHVALVDTGTQHSVPHLLASLAQLGLGPAAVDYVIATHVHLDHAGAAGVLLAVCPNACLVVHPKGARHLIDPAKLIAGSIAVYGEARFRQLYGDIVPAPADRVIEADDGHQIDFHGRVLTFIDTPGHARHHFCIHDSASNSLFTGDTFGISYREFDVVGLPFIFPTTTPVQFEPAALHASIDRLMALRPEAAYLTHYGRVTDLPRLAANLHPLIDEFVRLTRAAMGEGAARHNALKAAVEQCLLAAARAHGCTLAEVRMRELLAGDVELNTQGLLVWRDQM